MERVGGSVGVGRVFKEASLVQRTLRMSESLCTMRRVRAGRSVQSAEMEGVLHIVRSVSVRAVVDEVSI